MFRLNKPKALKFSSKSMGTSTRIKIHYLKSGLEIYKVNGDLTVASSVFPTNIVRPGDLQVKYGPLDTRGMTQEDSLLESKSIPLNSWNSVEFLKIPFEKQYLDPAVLVSSTDILGTFMSTCNISIYSYQIFNTSMAFAIYAPNQNP